MAAPIYRELSQKIERYIVEKQITGQLPGTRQLSREFGVHHVTLLKALHLLEEKGCVVIAPDRGVFAVLPKQKIRHRVIALIAANIELPQNRNLQAKLEEYLQRSGYSVIGISFDPDLFLRNKRILLNFPADGFIFLYSSLRNEQAEQLLKEKIPFVACSRRKDLPEIDQTDCDHIKGYSHLLDQLTALGHRRIAFCEFGRIPEYQPYLQDIFTLFSEKLKGDFIPEYFYSRETGLELWKIHGENYWKIYPQRAVEHFLNLSRPPTAIIAPHPLLLRIHHVLQQKGIKIPEEMTLASMNYSQEIPSSTDYTRIIYDEEKMFFWAVDRLLEKLSGSDPAPAHYFLEPLWHPGSTAAPPFCSTPILKEKK